MLHGTKSCSDNVSNTYKVRLIDLFPDEHIFCRGILMFICSIFEELARKRFNDSRRNIKLALIVLNGWKEVRKLYCYKNYSTLYYWKIFAVWICQKTFYNISQLFDQILYADDPDRRMQFCNSMTTKTQLFSDECVFGLQSKINQHNIHYNATGNPKIRLSSAGKTRALTVRACIDRGVLVTYDIAENTMNGQQYCDILTEKVVPAFTTESERT